MLFRSPGGAAYVPPVQIYRGLLVTDEQRDPGLTSSFERHPPGLFQQLIASARLPEQWTRSFNRSERLPVKRRYRHRGFRLFGRSIPPVGSSHALGTGYSTQI